MPDDDGETRQLDVLLGGSVFCDLVFAGSALPTPGTEVFAERFLVTPGGVATRAVAVARLGLRTGLAGTVGPDMFGHHVAQQLAAQSGLDLTWLRHGRAHTAVTVAVTDEHDRSFLTYEEDGSGVPEHLSRPHPSVTVCNIGLGKPVPPWVEELRQSGAVVYGGLGWDPSQEWSPDTLRRFEAVDVVCVNDVEATGYAHVDDADEAASVLAGPDRVAVVTCGGRGVVAHDGHTGEHLRVPAVPVRAVDPTGAGDVFMAGLILGRVQGWDLTTSVRFGTLTAALCVRRLGGSAGAPTPAEISAFLRDETPDGDWTFALAWANASQAAA